MLPLSGMTTSEKRREMERLWDDLCRNPENVSFPSWYETVLAERGRRVAKGEMGFIDLDEATERIRRAA